MLQAYCLFVSAHSPLNLVDGVSWGRCQVWMLPQVLACYRFLLLGRKVLLVLPLQCSSAMLLDIRESTWERSTGNWALSVPLPVQLLAPHVSILHVCVAGGV